MEGYICTQNMDVGYGKMPLIRQISLQVRRGQIVTLIGPNGAGKSTILKSIVGDLALFGGTVLIDEKSRSAMGREELARKLAVFLTERTMPEWMTCREVVAMGRHPYTGKLGILGKHDWEQVDAALALVRCTELADRDFSRISDGQRQRVLLARAVCQEPEAIVLDEPTSFLDIRHKLELLAILKDLVREKQVAVLLSLHELDLAQKLSDYVVCVKGDTIAAAGTPEEIFTTQRIRDLYEISQGSYYAELGSLELEPVLGEAKVFVIGGNGKGIATYRRLQREGIPFAVGVLHENDIDYPVAKALAVEVVTERAFHTIGEEAFSRAKNLRDRCKEVICCLSEEDFGIGNERNRELM